MGALALARFIRTMARFGHAHRRALHARTGRAHLARIHPSTPPCLATLLHKRQACFSRLVTVRRVHYRVPPLEGIWNREGRQGSAVFPYIRCLDSIHIDSLLEAQGIHILEYIIGNGKIYIQIGQQCQSEIYIGLVSFRRAVSLWFVWLWIGESECGRRDALCVLCCRVCRCVLCVMYVA